MKRFFPIILLLMLGGCAQQPYLLKANCAAAHDEVVLIIVAETPQRTQLVLHIQHEADGVSFIALNPVSAPLFSGTIHEGEITVEPALGYRGVDPQQIVWGYSLWRQRERAAACWAVGDNQLITAADDTLQLRDDQQQTLAIWRAAAPSAIELPRAKLQLTLRKLD